MARASTRQMSRDLPSSPPKPTSPPQRITRVTRSQSQDLDAPRPRQESVNIMGSQNEQQDSRGGRRAARNQAARRRDLSIVAEDPEVPSEEEDEQAEEEGDERIDEEEHERADEEEDPEATKVADSQEDRDEEDPDATKVASGLEGDLEDDNRSSFSDGTRTTSHSKRVMQIINSRSAIEALPDLYDTARKFINKSTKTKGVRPKEMSRHLKALESIFNELEVYKEPYGREQFIEIDIVLEKLSRSINSVNHGSSDLSDWATSFTAILQSANLATLLGQVNQLSGDNQAPQQELKVLLQSLEKTFPHPFVSGFADPRDLESEDSRLINETFDMRLEIQTQLFEITARQSNPSSKADLDKLLASCFQDGLEKEYSRTIKRVNYIRKILLSAEQATDSGRHAGLESLNAKFPTSEFFNELITYSENRWVEIEAIIENRGGITNVMDPFEKFINDIESDIEEDAVEDGESDLEPNDSSIQNNIVDPQASAPKSKRDFHANPGAIAKLLSFATNAGSLQLSGIEVSSKPDGSTNASPRIPGPSQPRPQQDSDITENFKRYSDSQNKENKSPDQPPRPRGLLSIAATSKRSGLYRKHPNAEKVTWEEDSQGFPIDSQADNPRPSQPKSNKRKADTDIPTDDEGESSDQAYQTDQRRAKTPRRIAVPRSSGHPRKRARTDAGESFRVQDSRSRDEFLEGSELLEGELDAEDLSEDEGFQADQNVPKSKHQRGKQVRTEAGENPRVARPPTPIVAPDDDEDVEQDQLALGEQDQQRRESSRPFQLPEDEGDDVIDVHGHSFTQASARTNVKAQAIKFGFSGSQTRTPWSDDDTQHLIEQITDFGPVWSEIERRGGFERDNISQIGLKDKARNIKVDILLAGQRLPRNFDGVKLNANLIKRVRKTWPDFDPYTNSGYATF